MTYHFQLYMWVIRIRKVMLSTGKFGVNASSVDRLRANDVFKYILNISEYH